MDDLRGEIERIEKRTRRYWFEDGIAEISTGVVFLLVALYFLISNALAGSTYRSAFDVAFPILVAVLAFAGKFLTRAIKDRYVHPRTGFIAFQRKQGGRWARGALAFAIAFLITLFLTRTPLLVNWIPALEGGLFAAGFLYIGRRVDIVRLPIEGLLCAIVGFALSILRVSEDLAAALLFGWLGVALLAGGVIAFVGYLRRTTRPEAA